MTWTKWRKRTKLSQTQLCLQTRAGHPGALREEAGASQQPLHGAKCHHAAAGDQRKRTAQVRDLPVEWFGAFSFILFYNFFLPLDESRLF